jgi:hypothetical protein
VSSLSLTGSTRRDDTQGDQQKETTATFFGYCQPGTDVKRNDTWDVTGPIAGSFRITGVTPPSKVHHMKVLLEEIQVGAE